LDGDQVLDFYWIDLIEAAIYIQAENWWENSTQNMSGRTLYGNLEIDVFGGPTQACFSTCTVH
jgi:hypothetical protein